MKKDIIFRPAWTEIDLSALEYNLKQVKRSVGKNVKILSVVKADAYGHGMIKVSKRLNKCGVDYFGVASIDEGIALRKQGIKKPILILENSLKRFAKYIVDYNLTQSISTIELAVSINNYAKRKGKTASVHIEIDTGMGRLGVWYKEAINFVKKINRLDCLKIEGLYTHFPCADSDRTFTNYQINCFISLIRKLKKCNIHIPLCHAANSIGVIEYEDCYLNLVRPGLMLYGIYPKRNLKVNLKPVLSFKTKIIYLKRTPAGRAISYGRTYITKKPTTIATLAVGYGDGYLRGLSNKADVLINGKRAKIVGRICMDQTMVDCGNLKGIKIGQTAVLVGRQGREQISLEELSHLAGTISYELVCSIGKNTAARFYEN
ncbi:MAG: alanine racemase [Candidatus Omnitrophota bacterium]